MTRRSTIIGLLVVAVGIVAVVFVLPRWRGRVLPAPEPGTVVLQLQGRYPARMTLPATVNWCPVTRVAEIEAISVDTGFAIALREDEAVTKGQHPIFPPGSTVPLPRPSASAALRWLRMVDTTVVAYRATGGHVDLDEVGATLSGSLLLYMGSAVGKDSVMVQGRFAGLKVVAMAAGCT